MATKKASTKKRPSKKAAPKKTASKRAKDAAGSGTGETPSRAMWSGTLGFGLLQIPVSLYPLERSRELSFHQLDGRDMQPVGYKRYNKTTGEEVPYEEIVRGYEIEKGEYVVVTDEELAAANVEATRAVDILDFVDPKDIPHAYFERPYLIAPAKRGEKAYAVLRDALTKKERAAIATVVLRTRQHLAAVLVDGESLVLELLRFPHELKKADAAAVAKGDLDPKITDREQSMAEALIDQMTSDWDPSKYTDAYRDDVIAMIEKKAKTGKAVEVSAPKKKASGNVTDLASLLQKSLKKSVAPALKKKAS